VTGDLV